jgi:hypothetical protein
MVSTQVQIQVDHMNSIAPKNPGSPSAAMNYIWDGKDSEQLFVFKEAWNTGLVLFANAWSAPDIYEDEWPVNKTWWVLHVVYPGKVRSSGDCQTSMRIIWWSICGFIRRDCRLRMWGFGMNQNLGGNLIYTLEMLYKILQ